MLWKYLRARDRSVAAIGLSETVLTVHKCKVFKPEHFHRLLLMGGPSGIYLKKLSFHI